MALILITDIVLDMGVAQIMDIIQTWVPQNVISTRTVNAKVISSVERHVRLGDDKTCFIIIAADALIEIYSGRTNSVRTKSVRTNSVRTNSVRINSVRFKRRHFHPGHAVDPQPP